MKNLYNHLVVCACSESLFRKKWFINRHHNNDNYKNTKKYSINLRDNGLGKMILHLFYQSKNTMGIFKDWWSFDPLWRFSSMLKTINKLYKLINSQDFYSIYLELAISKYKLEPKWEVWQKKHINRNGDGQDGGWKLLPSGYKGKTRGEEDISQDGETK